MTKSSERPNAVLTTSKARPVVPGSAVKVPAAINEAALLGDLRTLVQSAGQRIATAAYSTQTMLCWHMGRRLASEHPQGGRAAYGKQILVTLSQQLSGSHFHALLRQCLHRALEPASEQAQRRLPGAESRT